MCPAWVCHQTLGHGQREAAGQRGHRGGGGTEFWCGTERSVGDPAGMLGLNKVQAQRKGELRHGRCSVPRAEIGAQRLRAGPQELPRGTASSTQDTPADSEKTAHQVKPPTPGERRSSPLNRGVCPRLGSSACTTGLVCASASTQARMPGGGEVRAQPECVPGMGACVEHTS